MTGVVRVAALGDLHCSKTSQGAFQSLFAKIAESADVLLIAGDLTDYGLPEEAHIVARELSTLRMPVVAVLGNHDFESARGDEVRQIITDAGIVVLDGDAYRPTASASPGSRGSAAASGSAR